MVTVAIALALAILLSGLLSAAELSIFAMPEARVRALADQGSRAAKALAQLRARPDRVLVLLRLGDALADVSAGALTTWLVYQHFQVAYVALAVGAAAFAVLYVGELMPIGFAINRGTRFALVLAAPLLVVVRLLGPVLGLLASLARMRADRRDRSSGAITELEIRQLAALGQSEGAITAHERELVERAFRMDETKVWDIMTPRVDMFAWDGALRLVDIVSELGTTRYSRVPVYHETIDDVSGVLYLRDAYQALVAGQRDVSLSTLAREPLVVPGSLPLTRLLREFQNRRIHLAIVVDEYGGTDGLVTLEDVIEELVGEIADETDVPEEAMIRVSRTEIVAMGDADLREINHYFNTALPQLEHRSLNGYLLDELGRVPEAGEKLERDGVRIEVLEASDTQVLRARLRRVSQTEPALAAPPAGSPRPPHNLGQPDDGDML